MDYDVILERSFEKSYKEGLDLWTKDEFLNRHVKQYAQSLGNEIRRKILDIGTGKAQNSHVFLELGHEFTGIDIAEQKEWEVIKNNFPEKASFLKVNFLEWEGHDDEFTDILDVGCLHHQEYEKIPEYFRKVAKMLLVGGTFFLIVASFGDDESNHRVHQVENLPSGKIRNKFNICELQYLLSEAFDIERIQRIHNTKRNRYLLEIIVKKRCLD
jgi:SAM-dependent methyltransferase